VHFYCLVIEQKQWLIIKIVATRCRILRLKCTKFRFRLGSGREKRRGGDKGERERIARTPSITNFWLRHWLSLLFAAQCNCLTWAVGMTDVRRSSILPRQESYFYVIALHVHRMPRYKATPKPSTSQYTQLTRLVGPHVAIAVQHYLLKV